MPKTPTTAPVAHYVKKWGVVIGALLLVQIWFVSPYVSRKEQLLEQFRQKTVNLQRMRQMIAGTADFTALRSEAEELDRRNLELFFAPDKPQREALMELQEKARARMVDTGFEVSSITFGEPFASGTGDYVTLPLSFSATAGTLGLHRFFRELEAGTPIIKVENISIRTRRDALQVRGQLIGFTTQ